MREAPCYDCRCLTRWDLLADASDGAKPEMVCLECEERRDAERLHDDWCRCRHCAPAFIPRYAPPPDREPQWLDESE